MCSDSFGFATTMDFVSACFSVLISSTGGGFTAPVLIPAASVAASMREFDCAADRPTRERVADVKRDRCRAGVAGWNIGASYAVLRSLPNACVRELALCSSRSVDWDMARSCASPSLLLSQSTFAGL